MILDSQRFTERQIEHLDRKMDFYNSDEGENEIFNLMRDAKLFEVITADELPVRNYAIQKLTELGFNMEFKIRKAIHDMLQEHVPIERVITGDIYGND